MVGFAGRIFLEGDVDEAKALVGDAMKLAETLHAWKDAQRINNVTKSYSLRGGAYCVIVDLQNMRAMQIVAPVSNVRVLPNVDYSWSIPDVTGVIDVMSGVVTSPSIVKAIAPLPAPDNTTVFEEVDVINGFTPATYTATRYTDLERRRRLAVTEDSSFAPLTQSPALMDVVWSEHAHTKPSQYSGAMRRVVQFILGIGKIIRPTWEERWMNQQSPKRGYIEVQQVNPDTQLYENVESGFGLYYEDPAVTRLYYDYRFAKTHGISFDLDNKPWVIEISAQGVLAMPLYLDPVSTMVEGRARYLEVSPELEDFIDEFGGVPLGVSFPTGADLVEWKRAGEVVELLGPSAMSAFYSNSAFSSDIGWSFNSRGTEAHNCCAGILNNLSTGNHYRIKIALQREVMAAMSGARAELAGYFTDVYKINKCQRMTELQALDILRLLQRDRTAGLQAFDNATVTPTLQGTASMTLLRTGYLYNSAKPKGQPQIKFPEPLLGGLISFDFGPYAIGAGVSRCDTPMFVCFIDDEPEVVYYFYDSRPRTTPPAEYTREECQFTGIWELITYGGTPTINGNFYSKRWDWREEITPDTSVSTFDGRKSGVMGYATVEVFFSSCIWVSSSTWFTVKSKVQTAAGRSRGVAVAVPFHDRDCYYMVKTDDTFSKGYSTGLHTESTQGPQTQLWKLYNFVWHWRDGGLCTGNIDAGSIGCVAKKFGDWMNPSCVDDGIPAEIQYAVCPPTGYRQDLENLTVYAPLWGNYTIGSAYFGNVTKPSAWTETNQPPRRESACEIRLITNSGLGEIIAKKESVVAPNELTLDSWWFRFSPWPDDNSMPWMGVSESCLGSPIVNYHKDMDASQTGHAGGPDNLWASVYACYTGVTG